jgi:hypothetical protein
MKQHKWHKEIKAWADGEKIEYYSESLKQWIYDDYPSWLTDAQYRIKPQPKEPQYLYVHVNAKGEYFIGKLISYYGCHYIGKIKLEE